MPAYSSVLRFKDEKREGGAGKNVGWMRLFVRKTVFLSPQKSSEPA